MGKHVVTIFAGGWFLAPGVDIAILLDELKKYKTPSQYHEPPSTTIQPPIQSSPATVKEFPPTEDEWLPLFGERENGVGGQCPVPPTACELVVT